jgi:hypothetical protein
MPWPPSQAWQLLKRAPLAAPTYAAGFLAGLFASLAPGRDAKHAAARHRFIADWKSNLRHSLDDEAVGGPGGPTLSEARSTTAPACDTTLSDLRQSLLGLPKVLVSTLLGPPASSFHSASPTPANSTTYWQADTWYYPADLKSRVALAIHFDHSDRVSQIERLPGPTL